MRRVTNINGISPAPCLCGSWFTHWKKFSGEGGRPCFCAKSDCLDTAPDVAFVQRATTEQGTVWYVVPLCGKHAAYRGAINLAEDAVLVPIDPRETCGNTHYR